MALTKLVIDTNVYSAFFRDEPPALAAVAAADRVFMSPIVIGELEAGFRGGSRLQANLSDLSAFLARPLVEVAPLSRLTSDRYGRIFDMLRRKGRPIPYNDMWIAAQALELGADLVSYDGHFSAIEGLAFHRLGESIQG